MSHRRHVEAVALEHAAHDRAQVGISIHEQHPPAPSAASQALFGISYDTHFRPRVHSSLEPP